MTSIIVQNITRTYGNVKALNRISFNVENNETFGLIGPDGSGKTSLFRILTTLILPDSGIAKIENYDVINDYKKIRNIVGYMPGRFSLYQDLTVEENLNFFAALFHTSLTANYHLIEGIYKQIEPFKNRRAGKLSGGMKQKLALCCALIHKPQVLLLDEPTTGVDPVSRNEFWEILSRLKKEGITILVSTPYMDEATRCDRIALIKEGNILQINTPEQLILNFNQTIWQIKSENMHKLLIDARNYFDTYSCYPFGEYHHVTFKTGSKTFDFEKYLEDNGHKSICIEPIRANIEDCYLKMAQ